MLIRTFAGLCALALMLAVAACGDDEESGDSSVATAPVVTTDRVQTAEIEGTDTSEGQATSPEDQPGGAGDEEPARNEVVIDFSADGLSPSEVRVAPFIPVLLVIRSTDGTEYDLSYTAPASGGGANGTTEADFEIDGLRPGQEIEIEERNTDSTATVLASDAAGP